MKSRAIKKPREGRRAPVPHREGARARARAGQGRRHHVGYRAVGPVSGGGRVDVSFDGSR